jgi:hypothetical protein
VVLVLPEPLAPMLVPLPLVVVSVLAVPLEEAPGVVLVVPPAAVPLLELPLGVVVLGLPLGLVVVAPVEGVVLPGEAPAAPGAALESVVVDPLLLGVCAVAQPPIARAAAAASVVRVFLVVLISLLLEQNPEGTG